MEFTLNKAKINFKKAVELAKGFEGDWIARMALALKSVWKKAKKSLNSLAAEIKDAFLEDSISVQCNAWEKYGKHRVYVNYGPLKVGYFDFDEEGSYNKAWSEWTDWDMGKTTAQFKVIKECFEHNVF